MINLDFDTLTIENFKTFIGKHTLKLTGSHAGLRFVRGRNDLEPHLGSNGAAKSSLFDALTWCLYGRTVDDLRTPDVIPWEEWHVKEATCVKVSIYVNERRRVISRSTQPNKMLLDGLETDQDAINNLLGISFLVFSHTVLFGQGEDLFFDLEPKRKMDIFVEAMNLNRWDTRSEAASKSAKALEADVADFRAEFAEKEARLKQAQSLLKQTLTLATEWETERKAQRGSRSKELKQLEALLEKQMILHDDAVLKRDSAGTELAALNRDLSKLRATRDERQKDYSRVEVMLEGLRDTMTALEEELAGLTGKNDTCPTCGQTLKGTALARHKAELTERVGTLRVKVKAGVPKPVATALLKAVEALAKANEHAENFREKVDNAQLTIDRVGPEVARLETQIRHLKQQQSADEINPHRETLQNLRKRISTLESVLEEIDGDIVKTERELARTKFWVKGFKDIRLQLLEELLQELEMATNSMLPESGLHNWEVRYDIEKETKKGTIQSGLNLTVLSPKNKKFVKWKAWSGGEAHRLRVVGALALAEVLLSHAGVHTNLEILDEPTRDLSVEGVQDLQEYLANRADQLEKDIFFIDHMAVESNQFSQIITVVKNSKGSHIEA